MPNDTTHWLSKSRGLTRTLSAREGVCRHWGVARGELEALAAVPALHPPLAGLPQSLPLVKTPLGPRSSSLALQESAAKSFRALKTQERGKHPPKASKATQPLSASFSGRATSSLETNE